MKTRMLIQKFIFIILLLVFCKDSYCQNVTWGKILNNTHYCDLYKIQQTSDGGYITVGEDRIGIDYKIFVSKLNLYGDSVWSKYYDLNVKADYRGCWVEETYDKGYIISGSGDGPLTDSYLMKTDSLGNIQWVKVFSTPAFDQGTCVKELPDKGFILLNRTAPFPNNRIMLIRLDSSGNTLWSKIYGDYHFGMEVQYIENSGFIVAGWRRFEQENLSRLYLLRTDLNGDTIWSKLFYEFNYSAAYSIDVTEDRGFIIGGVVDTSLNFHFNAYILKTDSMGNIQWQQRYANGYNETCYSIRKYKKIGYVFCGFSDSLQNGFQRGTIRKIDLVGNILNEKYFRFGGIDNRFHSIECTHDNGLIICGGISTSNSAKGLVIKTDSAGEIYPVKIQNSNQQISKRFVLNQNFPNPFNPITIINFELLKSAKTLLIVYNIEGKAIKILINGNKSTGHYSIKFDGSIYPTGIYFYKLISGEFEETCKMLLIK